MKWLLAFPHYLVLVILSIAALVVVIVAWFAILFVGRDPPRAVPLRRGRWWRWLR